MILALPSSSANRSGPDGKPDDAYKAAVKKRFVQWVIDTCTRPRDQAWLDYQEEIGLRHTPAKKNATERAQTPELVPLRYLIAFTAPGPGPMSAAGCGDRASCPQIPSRGR
jgi:hypothetical protein